YAHISSVGSRDYILVTANPSPESIRVSLDRISSAGWLDGIGCRVKVWSRLLSLVSGDARPAGGASGMPEGTGSGGRGRRGRGCDQRGARDRQDDVVAGCGRLPGTWCDGAAHDGRAGLAAELGESG